MSSSSTSFFGPPLPTLLRWPCSMLESYGLQGPPRSPQLVFLGALSRSGGPRGARMEREIDGWRLHRVGTCALLEGLFGGGAIGPDERSWPYYEWNQKLRTKQRASLRTEQGATNVAPEVGSCAGGSESTIYRWYVKNRWNFATPSLRSQK